MGIRSASSCTILSRFRSCDKTLRLSIRSLSSLVGRSFQEPRIWMIVSRGSSLAHKTARARSLLLSDEKECARRHILQIDKGEAELQIVFVNRRLHG